MKIKDVPLQINKLSNRDILLNKSEDCPHKEKVKVLSTDKKSTFLKSHLKNCISCQSELEKWQSFNKILDEAIPSQRADSECLSMFEIEIEAFVNRLESRNIESRKKRVKDYALRSEEVVKDFSKAIFSWDVLKGVLIAAVAALILKMTLG